jgi:hypothetical protein
MNVAHLWPWMVAHQQYLWMFLGGWFLLVIMRRDAR